MLYQETVPRSELQAYINCFWMISSPRPTSLRDRTFPDGCQEIVFNVDTTVRRSEDGLSYTTNPAIELIGQMTKPYHVVTQGSQCFFGVKFFPHSFAAFTREPAGNLRDRSIDLRELLPSDFGRAADAVFERPAFAQFVMSMEEYFLKQVEAGEARSRSYLLVDRAVRMLLSEREHLRLETLPQRLGVSERYLQLMFSRYVGLSPKQLLRMIRFQNTFRYLLDRRLSLTDIAQRCGYYDHAHFSHDFRALAGCSPSGFRAAEAPLNRFFLTETSLAYLCDFKKKQYPF